MSRIWLLVALCFCALAAGGPALGAFQTDVIKTSGGDLEITPIGHASLMFKYRGHVIHVDPFGKMADYSKLPKADLVLITHEHGDHLDPGALKKVMTDKTVVVIPQASAQQVKGGIVMGNGDTKTVQGLKIEAVPAYNIVHKRDTGQPFHPKGRGNGYVITFGDKRVYVAGDTENTPEMKGLKAIDVAFLPINLPYTMTAEMVVDAVAAFKPKILYPYHYALGKTDVSKLPKLMKKVPGVELRYREKK